MRLVRLALIFPVPVPRVTLVTPDPPITGFWLVPYTKPLEVTLVVEVTLDAAVADVARMALTVVSSTPTALTKMTVDEGSTAGKGSANTAPYRRSAPVRASTLECNWPVNNRTEPPVPVVNTSSRFSEPAGAKTTSPPPPPADSTPAPSTTASVEVDVVVTVLVIVRSPDSVVTRIGPPLSTLPSLVPSAARMSTSPPAETTTVREPSPVA